MRKIVIIDDEQHAIDAYQEVIKDYTNVLQIVRTFTNPEIFFNHYQDYDDIDLLFLDIEMEPYSGFNLLNLLLEKYENQLPYDVIFVTAYDQHAVQAFSYNALDYLLKPLMKSDFERVIRKWETKENKFLHRDDWEQLKYLLHNKNSNPNRIAIPNIEGYFLLAFDDIIRCEADRNYTYIVDKSFKKHTVCRTLKDVEQLLNEYGFLRVHRSHIVNPNYVKRLLNEGGGTLEMIDGFKICMTQNKEINIHNLFKNIKKL